MSGGVFGALKDAILILDEVNRLSDNIRKLVDRVERLEQRVGDLETHDAVDAVKGDALVARLEAATRIAAAESHASLIERIVRIEGVVLGTPAIVRFRAYPAKMTDDSSHA